MLEEIISLVRQALIRGPEEPPLTVTWNHAGERDTFRYYLYSYLHHEGLKTRLRIAYFGTTGLLLKPLMTSTKPLIAEGEKSPATKFFEENLITSSDGSLLEDEEAALKIIWEAVNANMISRKIGEEAFARWKRVME